MDPLSEAVNLYRNHQLPSENWGLPPPAWYQSAEKAAVAGRVILALGLLLAGGTIAGSLLTSGAPMIVIASVGGLTSVVTFSFGTYYLFKKEFWDDPDFRMTKRLEIIKCLLREGYDETARRYRAKTTHSQNTSDWDRFHKQLISTETIATIITETLWEKEAPGLLDRIRGDTKTSAALLIDHGIISADEFTSRYVEEIKGDPDAGQPSLTFSQFIQKNGWQIFADGRVCADTQIWEMVNMRQHCQNSFSKFQTLGELSREFGTLFAVEKYGLVAVEQLRSLFLQELSQARTFDALYDQVSTYATDSGTFWDLLEKGIALKEDLHALAVDCFATKSFAQVIEKYGWNLFQFNLVYAGDDRVREAVRCHLNETSFTKLCEAGFDLFRHYYLLDDQTSNKINSLINRQLDAESEKARAIQCAEKVCLSDECAAANARDSALAAIDTRTTIANVGATAFAIAGDERNRSSRNNLATGVHMISAVTASVEKASVWNTYNSAVINAKARLDHSIQNAENQFRRDTNRADLDWKEFRNRNYNRPIPIASAPPEEGAPPPYTSK